MMIIVYNKMEHNKKGIRIIIFSVYWIRFSRSVTPKKSRKTNLKATVMIKQTEKRKRTYFCYIDNVRLFCNLSFLSCKLLEIQAFTHKSKHLFVLSCHQSNRFGTITCLLYRKYQCIHVTNLCPIQISTY